MILILEYDGESNASKDGIKLDAANLQRKLASRGESTKLVSTEAELRDYLKSTESKEEKKLHIVAHGNWVQIGNFNGGALGEFLDACGLDKRKNIKKITLHTCYSGSPNPDVEDSQSQAYQLAAFYHDKREFMQVRGSDGLSNTDSEGRNWVLKEGVESPGKGMNREREIGFYNANSVDRGTARPKFTSGLHNGGIWQI